MAEAVGEVVSDCCGCSAPPPSAVADFEMGKDMYPLVMGFNGI